MIKIYSKTGLTRTLNQLENGCAVELYLTENSLYMEVVMNHDKYYVSFRKTQYGGNLAFKECLNIAEIKQMVKELTL